MVKVKDMEKGLDFEGVYLVGQVELRETKKKTHYITLQLSDETGSITGKLWDANEDWAKGLSADKVVWAKGQVREYRGELDVNIDSIDSREATPEQLIDLLPRTPFQVKDLLGELEDYFARMEDSNIRSLMRLILSDESFVDAFTMAPAAMIYHHNYVGGLLEHVVNLMRAAEGILEAYPKINRDLVWAGCFLHDIGKVSELGWDGSLDYTTDGRLLGHIAMGTVWLEKWTGEIDGFPSELKRHLQHIVLSHHGKVEHGSPIVPMTMEAQMVHFLDNIDGKMWAMERAIDNSSDSSEWTQYSKTLRRRIFKQ